MLWEWVGVLVLGIHGVGHGLDLGFGFVVFINGFDEILVLISILTHIEGG